MKKICIVLLYLMVILYSFLIYDDIFRWFIYSHSIIPLILCSIDGFILAVSLIDLIDNIKS
jgi:hypothetical protein